MSKLSHWFKKGIIAALILTLGLAALPLAPVYAAGSAQDENPPVRRWQARRLEWIWSRQQKVYQRAGRQFDLIDRVVEKSQTLIDKANTRGLDVTSLKAALATYRDSIANAKVQFDNGQGIIDTHAGFNTDGKVTDRTQARQTIGALRQTVWDAREVVHEANQDLRQAYRDFHQNLDFGG